MRGAASVRASTFPVLELAEEAPAARRLERAALPQPTVAGLAGLAWVAAVHVRRFLAAPELPVGLDDGVAVAPLVQAAVAHEALPPQVR